MRNRVLVIVPVACAVILSVVFGTFGQDGNPKRSEDRVVTLEQGLRELMKRVEMLESRVKALESPSTVPGVPKVRAAWRQLRKGMTEAEVRKLLGEPKHIGNYGAFINWDIQGGGSVTFSSDGQVTSWFEPLPG